MAELAKEDRDRICEEVRVAEEARCTRANQRDWAGLEQVLADELVYSHSTAQVENKVAWIAGLQKTKRYFFRDTLKVHPYGELALTTGGLTQVVINDEGVPTSVLLVSSLQVWIARDGRWQMLANHNTRSPIVR